MFAPGSLVRYAAPIDTLEENALFEVLEAFLDATPPRVRIALCDDHFFIRPVEVVSPYELVAA